MELRLTKTQLQSRVWAAFYTNAAPPSCLSCVFAKRNSTSAEAVFEMVQAAALGYIEKQKKKRKKEKRGLKLELRLLNVAPTFTELRLIKRSFNSYGVAFYETQL